MTENEFLLFLQKLISNNLEKGLLTVCLPIEEAYENSNSVGLYIRLKNGNKFLLSLIKIFGKNE